MDQIGAVGDDGQQDEMKDVGMREREMGEGKQQIATKPNGI